MKHFKLHCLHYIWAIPEPQNQIITFFYTFCSQSDPVIKICQLICPLFLIISLLQFFQKLYSFFQTCFLCFQNTITQRKDTIIPWCQFHKFLIIFYRCNYIIQLNRHFTQRVQNRPVRRITFVCNL